MYNPNVPSSNMGIAPVSNAPSQPLGPPPPTMGMAPMAPPPMMGGMPPSPMMGSMPPPPMMGAPMAPPPMAPLPPIAPITEGLGGFGGSRSGRAGFSERMQRMTAPPKPRPMPMPQQMQQPVQGMQYGGSVSSQGLSMYQPPMNGGMHQMPDGSMMPNNHPSMGGMQQPMMQQPMGMMNGGSVPRQTEIAGQPHMLAYINPEEENLLRGLGGTGQPGPGGVPAYPPSERDSSGRSKGGGGYEGGGNRYTDPYEELARDYGYDPMDPYGDNDGGSDDDYDLGHLAPELIGTVPAPAAPAEDLVTIPEESGPSERVLQDILYGPADPTIGPNNAQEAVEQALADNRAGNIDIADSSLATLASRISRGRGDIMPARLESIDAISQDFAVPEAADTTLSDPDEIFGPNNPINLESIVGPNSRTDANGNLIPGRADTAADIEAGTLAARNFGPEVMSSSPMVGGRDNNYSIGQYPTSIGGKFDLPIIGTDFSPSGPGAPSYGDPMLDSLKGRPSVSNATPPAPKMALPGGSARTPIEGGGLSNPNRAKMDLLVSNNKRGINSIVGLAEETADLQKELKVLQGRAGERFANNIDEATSFYKPVGTGEDALAQMLSEPANYEINRVGRLSPEKLAKSPFTNSEAEYVFPPTGAPITDAELSEARDIYGDFDPTLDDPYTDGGYQPNLRREPFGPVGPESSFPGYGKVNPLALPADTVFPQASADQIGGGITYVPEGGPDYTARRAGEILENLKTAPIVAPPSDIQLEVAQPTANKQELGSFNNAMDASVNPEIAGGGLMSGTPGMQSYLAELDASASPGIAATGLTKGAGSGFNRTTGPVFTGPDGKIIVPDSQKINASARAAFGNSGALSNEKIDDILDIKASSGNYYTTGAGSQRLPTEDEIDAKLGRNQATPEALKRAESDVSALDRIAKARIPTDDMQIVSTDPAQTAAAATATAAAADETNIFDGDNFSIPPAPERTLAGGNTTTEGGAQLLQSALSKVASGSIGDLTPAEQYALRGQRGETPNKGETNLIRNAMAGARHTEDGKGYKKGDLVVEDRIADKVLSGFETVLSFLLPGPMDFKAMSQENRNKALQAYKDTGKIVYEKGKPVGFEDKEGGLVRLVPKGQDDTGGDSDGCPPGFRRVNGVCMPIQRVARNPATAISDSIASATLPNTLRPIVRDVVDDEEEEEEKSDVGGLTIRRPSYFANGGAVSEGMGSAIDNFLSSMGGNVKKKSDVAPVGMALGGFVGNKTTKDYSNNDYTDPYEELGRDYGYDPTDPFGDGNTSYGDDGPSDTVTADTFIGPMQPNVTYQPPAAPVDTGGDDKHGKMMSFADDLRLTRQETSPFSSIYAANTQLDNDLALQGRRPVLGGILSKEPVAGADTLRFEGFSGLKNLGVSMMDPVLKAFDSPRAAYMGLIPEEDMAGEALGLAGLVTLGGGMLRKPVVQTSTSKPLNVAEQMAKEVLELRAQGRASEVTEAMMAKADPQYMFKNTPLDMSKAARRERLAKRGFDVDETVYTGSGSGNIQKFRKEPSGIFATPAPGLADSYVPRASRLAGSNDPLETAGSGSMYPLYAKKGTDIDVKGSNYGNLDLSNAPKEILDKLPEVQNPQRYGPLDVSDSGYSASGLMREISGSDPNFTGINFKNIYDYGPFGGYSQRYGYETPDSPSFIKREDQRASPQTVVARANPSDFKSVFARADPEFDHLSNILAANRSKAAGLGAIAASNKTQNTMIPNTNVSAKPSSQAMYDSVQVPTMQLGEEAATTALSNSIQEMIDQLNKKAPLAEFENQKGQMVSGGLSGRELDFALNKLARRLGIERPK